MKEEIKGYLSYLQLFSKEDGQGALIFSLQQHLIALEKQEGDWDSLEMENLPLVDFWSDLFLDSAQAIGRILALPQEKVLRDHALVPSYQLREMDSYCVKWLSRQSGRTKKEKLAMARKVMGVKRQRSGDTGENRLFMAYLKKMEQILRQYLQQVPRQWQHPGLYRLQRSLRQAMATEFWQEVGQWQNLPPNNTLLSHKDYGQIWKAWIGLRHLDQDICALVERVEERVLTLLMAHLLFALGDLCYCPQVYLEFSPEEGRFCRDFACVDGKGRLVTVEQKDKEILLRCGDKESGGKVAGTKMTFSQGKAQDFAPEKINQYILLLLAPLDLEPCPERPEKQSLGKVPDCVVDLWNLSPLYQGEEGHARALHSLLYQNHSGRALPCHHSRALDLSQGDFYTILSTLPSRNSPHSPEDLREMNRKLVQDLKKSLPAQTLCYLTPDGVDEFLLGDFHGNLRSFYEKVESFPKSLALTFCHQNAPGFQRENLVLVVDLLGNRLSITPLQPTTEEVFLHKLGAKHPYIVDFGGLVWERHPSIREELDLSHWEKVLTDQNLPGEWLSVFGAEGLSQWDEGFPIFRADGSLCLWKKPSFSPLDIRPYVEKFLAQRGDWEGRYTLLTSCPFLTGVGLQYYSTTAQLGACGRFRHLQQALFSYGKDLSLWRDMLPQLEIHVGVAEIPLVPPNQKIRPQYGVAVEIPVAGTMVLEGGKEVYRFKVKKEDSLQRYQAVVHRDSFGVMAEEIHCQLEMTYEYGAQEPYCLYLIPEATGRKIKVEWQLQGEEDWADLAYPPFPQGMAVESFLYGEKTATRAESLRKTWVPLLESWQKVTGEDLEEAGYVIQGEQGARIRFSSHEVERQIYYLENPRSHRVRPVANGAVVPLCYDVKDSYGTAVASHLTSVDKRLSDQRFALYRLCFNGRRLADLPAGYGRDLLAQLADLQALPPPKGDKLGQFHFLMLCLLYEEMGDGFYALCQEKIRKFKPKAPWVLPDCIGFALGDLSTEQQEDLLEAVWTLPARKGILILSKAMWNHEDFVFACDGARLLQYFDTAVDYLGELYREYQKDTRVSGEIAMCLEFMLAVFRLRQEGEAGICRHLSLNHPKMQGLKSLVATMAEERIGDTIYSNIQLKRRDDSRLARGKENFFQLFLLYLVGDLAGAEIQIIQNIG